MSTRLSTEELAEIKEAAATRPGFNAAAVMAFVVAEVEASWNERDAARRALRDLTDREGFILRLLDELARMKPRYTGMNNPGVVMLSLPQRDALVAEVESFVAAARAVLSEGAE